MIKKMVWFVCAYKCTLIVFDMCACMCMCRSECERTCIACVKSIIIMCSLCYCREKQKSGFVVNDS